MGDRLASAPPGMSIRVLVPGQPLACRFLEKG
jgi:hypothetical protein